MIKRYNRSFIGLMEQCNTGEWCKWEDIKVELKNLEQANEFWKVKADEYRSDYFRIYAIIANYRVGTIMLVPSLIFNIVTIVGLIL